MLLPGDPAPDFRVASNVNPNFHFDTVAGRYILLCFFASSEVEFSAKLLAEVGRRQEDLSARTAVFFGLSVDPQDVGRLPARHPGLTFFWDVDQAVSQKYGAIERRQRPERVAGEEGAAASDAEDEPGDRSDGPETTYRPRTVLLDRAMRVMAVSHFGGEPAEHLNELLRIIDALPAIADDVTTPAPVLVIPHVFERDLCRTLMNYYDEHGGEDSGFMRDVGGKTVAVMDYGHKRRMDCDIKDEGLIRVTQERLSRRVVPAIKQAFQFNVTRIERHIVACYDAADGGHFRAHRDNTTLGTAHRRFAVTLNLNAEEFEGGELWFPEFSRRKYKAPTGGCVVFSCSLLHEATKVTKGRRYAFLPFLYDDAAARIRERNRQFVSGAPPVQGAAAVR